MKSFAGILTVALFGICICMSVTSCGKKETTKPAVQQADDAAKATTMEKVGKELNAAADYATGKTQLEIKKNKTSQLQEIQNKANRQLEDALKE